MLVKPHQLFADALTADYAIGAFNASHMEVVQGIMAAAEELKSPVIVQTSEGAIEYAGLNMISDIIKRAALDSSVPAVMHLDHGHSLDMVKKCIEVGYTSVMIDMSKKDFADNMRETKEVVDYAHERGVWVEAELGAIIGKEGMKDLHGAMTPDAFLTDPAQVVEFTKTTGVDALAVSVGTIHGAFSGQEYIRFELLEKIKEMVPHLPLVLHGASGIANEHLRKACTMHVCKVNVDTELRQNFVAAVKAYFDTKHESVDTRDILGPAREAIKQKVAEKIAVFGSNNMAKVY